MSEKKPVRPPVKPTKKVPAEKTGPLQTVPIDLPMSAVEGDILQGLMTKDTPALALGDAIARWEDAMLKQDWQAACEIAFDIAWLARECELRRGDQGNAVLMAQQLPVGE